MNRARPKPQALGICAPEPRLDFGQDREGDLLGLLGAEVQTDRAVESRSACRRRLKPALGELAQQSLRSRAGAKNPHVRAFRLERELEIAPVVTEVVRHDHHGRIGLQS